MAKHDEDEPGVFKMGTFSALTGVDADLLRAWERRHGLLEPQRLEGRHRVYTEKDRRVIVAVKRRLEAGRSIGEVALLGRERLAEEGASELVVEPPIPPGATQIDALVGQVIEAGVALDEGRVRSLIDRAFATWPTKAVVDGLILPVARELGDRWARGELSVATEHMVSAELDFRVHRLFEFARAQLHGSPRVLCACLPGEQHELGLRVLALKLCEAGVPVVYLGRDLPIDELEGAVTTVRALHVCVSAMRKDVVTACAARLAALARRHPKTVFHLGGAGVDADYTALERAGVRVWRASQDETAELIRLIAA